MRYYHFIAATAIAIGLVSCSASTHVVPQQNGSISTLKTQLLPPTGTFKVLYNFAGQPDGANAQGGLIGLNGTLYGTTSLGGMNNVGTVFSITLAGVEKVLHDFVDGTGVNPAQPLHIVGGTLYSVTQYASSGNAGCGTVFSITPAGSYKLLYPFAGGFNDGCEPMAPLKDVNGTLYATTFGGGTANAGTLYSITTSGSEKVLYNFSSGPNNPNGPLIDVNGTLYGTSALGGTGSGTVYKSSLSGSVKTVYKFAGGNDGFEPQDGLVNVNGTFFGVTIIGGTHNKGTVYSVTPAGVHKVLYSFGSKSGDGTFPASTLVTVKGTLYGTTDEGGKFGFGTIYKVTTSGTETVLHPFSASDGENPEARLFNMNGTLYGTTVAGGSHTFGTVYSFVP